MISLSLIPSPPAPAVLLVLLPVAVSAAERAGRAAALAGLGRLQRQLDAAIQVLSIDEASYPAVVHSFDLGELPAFLLTWHGTELWRAQGLPDGEGMAAMLLSKLPPAAAVPELRTTKAVL